MAPCCVVDCSQERRAPVSWSIGRTHHGCRWDDGEKESLGPSRGWDLFWAEADCCLFHWVLTQRCFFSAIRSPCRVHPSGVVWEVMCELTAPNFLPASLACATHPNSSHDAECVEIERTCPSHRWPVWRSLPEHTLALASTMCCIGSQECPIGSLHPSLVSPVHRGNKREVSRPTCVRFKICM
jgi:hypothetical protein